MYSMCWSTHLSCDRVFKAHNVPKFQNHFVQRSLSKEPRGHWCTIIDCELSFIARHANFDVTKISNTVTLMAHLPNMQYASIHPQPSPLNTPLTLSDTRGAQLRVLNILLDLAEDP